MKATITIITASLVLAHVAWSAFGQAPDPTTLHDKVTLKLNDKVTVTFQAQGDTLTKPNVAAPTEEKPSSISFSFTMEQGVRMLTIQNAFSRGVRMRCLARASGQKEFVESTVHPLYPTFFSTEAFGDPVEELVLFDFKLTNDKLPQ
jgi:hypothetical protein